MKFNINLNIPRKNNTSWWFFSTHLNIGQNENLPQDPQGFGVKKMKEIWNQLE